MNSSRFKLKKIILKFIIILLLIFFLVAILPYLISPVYKFPEKTIFKGKYIHNPYENLDSTKWIKANFHCHSKVYSGITRGYNSSIDTIIYVYKLLKYDIIGISNYMKIFNEYLDSGFIMPAYEHGYGLFKVHYLVIGNERVNLIDFLFPQSLSNKQFIIKNLKDPENIIAIVHPNIYNAFTENDFEYLTDYDCVEILRYDRVSTKYWDAALSAGNLKYLLADDDSHDITAPYEVGRCFTMINSPFKDRGQIIKAIKEGKTYAIDWRAALFDSLNIKLQKLSEIPYLQYLKLNLDTIKIKVNKSAQEIAFIGQYGMRVDSLKNTDFGLYKMKDSDSYIRIEITFFDNTKMYLNPLIRYDDENPLKIKSAQINIFLTLVNKLIYLTIIIFFAFLIIYFRKKRKQKSKILD